MSDFPQTHTTHTTTTTTSSHTAGGGARVQFDISYIKTIPGILHCVEALIALITFSCAVSACNAHYVTNGGAGCGWAGFISFIGMLLALGWLVFHLLRVDDALPAVPWILIELGVYALWTFFFFTAGISLSVYSNNTKWFSDISSAHSTAGAGAFFAFVAMLIWGFHTFLIFREWRRQVGSAPAAAGQQGGIGGRA